MSEIAADDVRRQEIRMPVDSVALPFLGTRASDLVPFQYLVLNVSDKGAAIAVARWMVHRENLLVDDQVYLHLPFRFGDNHLEHGSIQWVRWDEESQSQLAGLRIDGTQPFPYAVNIIYRKEDVYIDLQSFPSIQALAYRLIKDSALLKHGILVYLKHLAPYFSRVGGYTGSDYSVLETHFFGDIAKRVEANAITLATMALELRNAQGDESEILIGLDLEKLREYIESELSLDLFRTVFESARGEPYLHAIKMLEARLYFNYNLMVMLYLRALT